MLSRQEANGWGAWLLFVKPKPPGHLPHLPLAPPVEKKTSVIIWFAYPVPLLVEAGGFGPVELGGDEMYQYTRVRRSRVYQLLLDLVRWLFPELHDERDLSTFCKGCRYDYYEGRVQETAHYPVWHDKKGIPY